MTIFNFFKPYQYATIAAGESGTVFLINVPVSCRAFIQFTGNSFFPESYMEWKIDDELIEKVERQIAPIFNARREIPPIIAKHKIEWIATNNHNYSHVFEVLQDGVFVTIK